MEKFKLESIKFRLQCVLLVLGNRDAFATTFHQLPTKIVTTTEVEPRVITLPPEKT